MDEKKVFFYSTHDSMIAALLSALKSFDKQNPDYGSSIIFELYQSNHNNSDKLQLVSTIYYLKK